MQFGLAMDTKFSSSVRIYKYRMLNVKSNHLLLENRQTMKTLFSLALMLGCLNDLSTFAHAAPTTNTEPLVCDYYDIDACAKGNMTACNSTVPCAVEQEGKRSHCYALWDSASVVRMKGCWLDHIPCYDKQECVVNEVVNDGRMFCCCEGVRCNSRLVIPPTLPTQAPRATTTPQPYGSPMAGGDLLSQTLMLTILPLAIVSLIILALFCLCRNFQLYFRHHGQSHLDYHEPEQLLSVHEHHVGVNESVYVDEPAYNINKIEVKAHGRFGSVWKAQMSTKRGRAVAIVAVKVFPLQDRVSWETERDFYSSVQGHRNILRYIGAEMHGVDPTAELWLITEYHKHGSLYDHLKTHAIGVPQVLRIALSMYRGLSYLHAVLKEDGREKPSMAHRDVKSRNVLLKDDMTACIADFGLVLKLGPGLGSVHNQVGTRRYMSPEVLDGSISFSIDNFLKIDMYASALVLWELLSRCSMPEVNMPADYRMPFENEVGSKPSLEIMQDWVVTKKFRPEISKHWQQHEMLGALCLTMEECWDQDPEARLSAECVEARLALMCTKACMPSTESVLCTSLSTPFPEKDSANTTLTTSTTSSAVS